MIILCKLSISTLKGVDNIKNITCFNIKENLYSIDEFGNIYSFYFNKYIKQRTDKDGYKDTCLVCKDDKRRHFRIHRLVAKMFLEDVDEKRFPIVLHKDNNKTNNHYSNLKWGTVKENTQQAYSDFLVKESYKIAVFTNENVFIKIYPSTSELCREFNIPIGNVNTINKFLTGKSNIKHYKLKKYNIKQVDMDNLSNDYRKYIRQEK